MTTKRISTFTLTIVFALCNMVMVLAPARSHISQVNAYSGQETLYKDIVPFGGTPILTIFEHIHYTRREVVQNVIWPNVPNYFGVNCGVTGAGNKIAFYNRQFPQLIPGHNPGFQFGNNWFWTPTTPQITAMMDELNVRMGGRGRDGVTFVEYFTGYAQFVHFRGLTTSFAMHRAADNAVLPSFFDAIANGVPVSMFFSGYNLTGGIPVHATGHDVIALTQHSGNHIMIAFGYQRVYYFDAYDNMFRQDLYVRVSDGFGSTGWARINTHSTLNNAITLNIFA